MKKNLMIHSLGLAVTGALVLSGCGQSVEDARADAYATINSMEGLGRAERDEYTQQLNSAADQAAIDNIVSNAQSDNNTKLAKKTAAAQASAEASANAVIAEGLIADLQGMTLTGTTPGCEGKTLTVDKDGQVEGSGQDEECLNLKGGGITVKIGSKTANLEARTYLNANDKSPSVEYDIIDNGDGTYTFTFLESRLRKDYGREGSHTFTAAPSSESTK